MEYTHPKKYKGIKFDTPNNQDVVKAIVEKYCLKCSLFMGKEHDFSECNMYDVRKHGTVVDKQTCPFNYISVSAIDPKSQIKCKVEGD